MSFRQFLKCLFGFHKWAYDSTDVMFKRSCHACGLEQEYSDYLGEWSSHRL